MTSIPGEYEACALIDGLESINYLNLKPEYFSEEKEKKLGDSSPYLSDSGNELPTKSWFKVERKKNKDHEDMIRRQNQTFREKLEFLDIQHFRSKALFHWIPEEFWRRVEANKLKNIM